MVRVGREFNLLKSRNEIARRHAMIAILQPRERNREGRPGKQVKRNDNGAYSRTMASWLGMITSQAHIDHRSAEVIC